MPDLSKSIKGCDVLPYKTTFKTIADKWGGVHGSIRISLELEKGRIYALKGIIEKNINGELKVYFGYL